MITHGELFAGIGGFGIGFERAGIETRWAVEIDPQARAVLAARWPGIALYEDVREVGAHNLEAVDVITFGSPCQDLSVAGKREGLAGERSGLYFEAVRIVAELRPAVAVWENVAGALSSHGGADFHTALEALANVGALDIGWAVLDAQWFGVPQRRRRVFTVADFRGRRAGEILALDYGLQGHPAPRRETGAGAAGDAGAGVAGGRGRGVIADGGVVSTINSRMGSSGPDAADAQGGWLIPYDAAGTVSSKWATGSGGPAGFDASEDGTGRGTPLVVVDDAAPLGFQWRAGGNTGMAIVGDGMGALHSDQAPAIAFAVRGRAGGAQAEASGDLAPALRTPGGGSSHAAVAYGITDDNGASVEVMPTIGVSDGHKPAVAFMENQQGVVRTSDVAASLSGTGGKPGQGYPAAALEAGGSLMVRRLTPLECCRLQGFPDDWLCDLNLSDSAKYRMLGNAVAVPVVEWLGRSIVAAWNGGW